MSHGMALSLDMTPYLWWQALRRIAEGASMIRLKGNAGTGNVMNAVRAWAQSKLHFPS